METRNRKVQAVILMVLLMFCIWNAKPTVSMEVNEEEQKETKLEVEVKTENVDISNTAVGVAKVFIPRTTSSGTAGVAKVFTPQIYELGTVVAPEENYVQSANDIEDATEEENEAKAEETLSDEQKYIVYMVAKTIHGEAGICDADEKYKVGTVFMNRYERADFPNTIEGVLRDGYECYQNEAWFNEEPTENEIRIAEDIVLNGTRVFDKTVVFQSKKAFGEIVDITQWHEYGSLPLPEE